MRAFRIPAALLVAVSLALFGCADLATGPDVEDVDVVPQFVKGGNNDQGEQEPCSQTNDEALPPNCDEGDQGDDDDQGDQGEDED